MPRKERVENWRIEVTPTSLSNFFSDSHFGNEPTIAARYKDKCLEMESAIRRHVDHVALVETKFDRVLLCEFCGKSWTEDSATYNGGCCDQDQEGDDSTPS